MKKTMTAKQIADYEQLCGDRANGRLLTLDGLRLVCESNNLDPKAATLRFLVLLIGIAVKRLNVAGIVVTDLVIISSSLRSDFGSVFEFDRDVILGCNSHVIDHREPIFISKFRKQIPFL